MAGPALRRFPDGFVWGAATAAYQIEGAARTDGRGPSIWDVFCTEHGRTLNGDNGDIACDHYNRLDDDLDLMADLGLQAYRFSVSWPRVQPAGSGAPNRAGLDFYRRLVDGLLGRGIRPLLTLYHWDLPQALEDRGGWTSAEVACRFADYAAVVARALGDRVPMWVTLNEPWCSAWLGYAAGVHAPGRRDLGAATAATHHLLLGHGLAAAAVRSESPTAEVGITLNLAPVVAASGHPDDLDAARRADANLNRLFLEPLLCGRYPADVAAEYRSWWPDLPATDHPDLRTIATPLDFLGVNYYAPRRVSAPSRLPEAHTAGLVAEPGAAAVALGLRAVDVAAPERPRTAMGWEIEPAGLARVLRRIAQDYTPVPLYITENGAAFHDYADPHGRVRDPERIEYLEAHIHSVHEALACGVDVRGYFVWSLLDNFEWSHGYSKRFGLTYVDYPTRRRLPKASFHWYRGVIAANGC